MTHWYSPSQITAWDECKRKWGWRYLDRLRMPPNPAAKEGLKGHAILERYLTTASIDLTDPLAERCAVGLHLLPAPGTSSMQIEIHFGVQIGQYRFHGYKDVQIVTAGIPSIYDHKFTANLKWAKNEATLRTDTQVIIYSFDAMLRYQVPKCNVNWTYFQRRGAKKTIQVSFSITGAELIVPLQAILKTSNEIAYALRWYTTAKQLPPSVEQCEAYGGCPYRQHCNLNWYEKWQSMLQLNAAQQVFRSRTKSERR